MGRSVASSTSKQHPSYRLLEQNGFQQEAYEQYRRRCLKERKAVGMPICSPRQPHAVNIAIACEQALKHEMFSEFSKPQPQALTHRMKLASPKILHMRGYCKTHPLILYVASRQSHEAPVCNAINKCCLAVRGSNTARH